MNAHSTSAPIACDFHQIPAERREPLLAQLHALFQRVSSVKALQNGFALEFPGERGMATALSALIEYDRLCCPFIRHALVDEPWGGSFMLELTGTDEVRDFLAGELRTFLPPQVEVPSLPSPTTAARTF